MLFGGSTESTAQRFAQSAGAFKGSRVIVGRVKAAKKSEFNSDYSSCNCELSGPDDKKHEVGKPIWMLNGWANLIQNREHFNNRHGTMAQMVHMHAPVNANDIHGNSYMSSGKLGKIKFTVKELPDGTLMAKPRNFEKYDYKSSANYNKGHGRSSAMGQEKLFGGVVGSAVCACRGVPDFQLKGQLIKNWKLGKGIKITNQNHVGNSIEHSREMSTKRVSILWRPGDWAMGCFFMQTLPQSSYLQGKGECLYCAVENAALVGCPEVIACGGGRVSDEALKSMPMAIQTLPEPIGAPHTPVPGDTKDYLMRQAMHDLDPALLSPVSSIMTPPPASSSPPASARVGNPDYFVFSDARGDKIVPANGDTNPFRPNHSGSEKASLFFQSPQPTQAPIKETAIALYDFDSQLPGELSFVAGDEIEIINVGEPNTWWWGCVGARGGLFPGEFSLSCHLAFSRPTRGLERAFHHTQCVCHAKCFLIETLSHS